MLKIITQQRNHYLVLFGGLGLGLLVFFSPSAFLNIKVYSVIGLCIFYFIWGIIHHYLEKDLHFKIILEYFAVSLIACFILLSLIYRAIGG